MSRNWIEPKKIVVPEYFCQAVGEYSLTSQVLYSRGITDPDDVKGFLNPQFYRPTSGLELPGLEKLTRILHQSILDCKKIGVWGDFDVDGQTSTAILVSAIKDLGGDVIFHIPVRASESHGLGLHALEQFIQQGVNILLTCDTGITSHESVDYARQRGISVLISDHHDLPPMLPDADAIVNPKMLPKDHPLSFLPGVGVAYKIVEQLFQSDGEEDRSLQYLDLVALGIVADLALLKGDNRYLLQRGIEELRRSKRTGLLTLMEMAELNQANLSEEHISFILAPRMNAPGRLADANKMVELLTTSDVGRARILAIEIEGLNAQRILLSDQVYQAAEAQIAKQPKLLDTPIIVLSHPTWPAGVIGIVASRLVNQYHRPVILFSSPPGEDARGSARSIEGVNITNVIAENRRLIKIFGGHPMAAGLLIDQANIPLFLQSMSSTLQQMGIEIRKEKELQIDGYISLPELNLPLVEDLERLAPFGPANPPVVLATQNLGLTGYSTIGRNDDHLQLTLEDELGYAHRSIWWQGAGLPLPETSFDLAYSVRASTYRGQRDVQIEWIDYRLASTSQESRTKQRAPEVIDFRTDMNPFDRLRKVQQLGPCSIWGESLSRDGVEFLDRFNLSPAQALAIMTIPPGSSELRTALKSTIPEKIYLFGIDPGMDDPQEFLKRLLGLLKYRLKTANGSTTLASLAAATAQKVSTIKLGLDWLESRGLISSEMINEDTIKVVVGDAKHKESTIITSSLLNSAMSESAAFRRYYLRADKDQLIALE